MYKHCRWSEKGQKEEGRRGKSLLLRFLSTYHCPASVSFGPRRSLTLGRRVWGSLGGDIPLVEISSAHDSCCRVEEPHSPWLFFVSILSSPVSLLSPRTLSVLLDPCFSSCAVPVDSGVITTTNFVFPHGIKTTDADAVSPSDFFHVSFSRLSSLFPSFFSVHGNPLRM